MDDMFYDNRIIRTFMNKLPVPPRYEHKHRQLQIQLARLAQDEVDSSKVHKALFAEHRQLTFKYEAVKNSYEQNEFDLISLYKMMWKNRTGETPKTISYDLYNRLKELYVMSPRLIKYEMPVIGVDRTTILISSKLTPIKWDEMRMLIFGVSHGKLVLPDFSMELVDAYDNS